MSELPQAALLCRYGELFLKQGNRTLFEQMLVGNTQKALRDLPGARVQAPHGRLLVWVRPDDQHEAARRLARVFGVVSLSPVAVVAADLDAISDAAIACARAAVARDPEFGRSFKVQARRADKRFPLTSYDIAREAGSRVNVATGIPVEMQNPGLTIGVEVRAPAGKGAFVYADRLPGPGGLPVGSAGRGLLLLSGGIDSPVAGWLAAKRGMDLDAVYFHSPPFVGEKTRDKIIELGRALNRWQACRSVTVVHFTDVQKRLRAHGKPALAVVLYRRMMMRIADRIADDLRADALVTGENLGQVASQTLRNMTTIEAVARHLVVRPLVTYDKNDTIVLAKRIGTFDLSVAPYEDCCSLFMPEHPATGARVSDAVRSEAGIDCEAEAARAAETAERVLL